MTTAPPARPTQAILLTIMLLCAGAAARDHTAEGYAVRTKVAASAAGTEDPSARQTLSADDPLRDAREAIRARDYAHAVRILELATKQEPSQLAYRCELARANQLDGHVEEAESILWAVLDDDSSHTEARRALANILVRRGAFEQVISILEPVIKGEVRGDDLRLLAESHYNLNHLREARRCYRQLIERDDRSPRDHFQLGNVYLKEANLAMAIERFNRAAQLGMSDARLNFGLARAYHELGNDLGMAKSITIPRAPFVAPARPGQIADGFYLLERLPGKDDTLLASPSESAVYQVCVAMDKGLYTPEVRLLAARIWIGARRYERAVAAFRSLEGRVSRVHLAQFHLEFARALYGADDVEGYLSQLAQALAIDPTDSSPILAEAYRKVAARYNQRGDIEQYIKYLNLALVESPDSADLHYELGNGYWEAAQKHLAARHWQYTLEIEPEHPDRLRMLEIIRAISEQAD